MNKKLLLFAVLSLIVMSAPAQLKRSAAAHAPTRPQVQLVKPEAKMERATMRQPGTPVAKPPKKAGSVDVWYRHPAGAFVGSIAVEDGVYAGSYMMPFIYGKPYSEYTFNGVATGVSNNASYMWDVRYRDGNDDPWASVSGKDLTWTWGYEMTEVPHFHVNDGNNSWEWYIKGIDNGTEYPGYLLFTPNTKEALGYDMLMSSKTFCYGGRYGDQAYSMYYLYGPEPYGSNEKGWWLGKNSGHVDGIAQAFEKPEHPYRLKQVAMYCSHLDVTAPVKMTCRIYKLSSIPAYDDNGAVVLPEEPGEFLCEGEATVTPATYDNTGGLVFFTLYGEEDDLTYEIEPVIEDAILVVIDGYNSPEMANITDFSALCSSDFHADEGFGELAYIKYGFTDENGNLDYHWVGLNNLLEIGEMKTGLTIFLNIEHPFIVFNYPNENGEYTFPAEGGLMEKDLGDGTTTRSIEFYSSVPSEYENWNLHHVPDWLHIQLTDDTDQGEFTGLVNAEVNADPLPEGMNYREAVIRFDIYGDHLDYKFMQGEGSNPGDVNYYIVGSEPFGNWHTNAGVKMSLNNDGTYSYTATIDGATWFVFADGLTTVDGDWDIFNNQYRYGPSNGQDETVEEGVWHVTQKQGNGNGAYLFTGNGSEYIITFNPYIRKFKIESKVNITAPPVINCYETFNGMTVKATGQGHICLYLDGVLHAEGENSAEYTIPCGSETKWILASATAQEAGKEISDFTYLSVTVPTHTDVSGDIVFIAGIDNGTSDGTAAPYSIEKQGVLIEVTNGLANSTQYRFYKYQTVTITSSVGNISKVVFDCIAEDDAQYGPGGFTVEDGEYTYSGKVGTWIGSAQSVVFTASNYQVRASKVTVTIGDGPAQTAAPTISTEMTDDAVIVTATGDGEVKLYKDGVEVENPCTIARTNVDQQFTFTATAHEEGKLISETATTTVVVPALEVEEGYQIDMVWDNLNLPLSNTSDVRQGFGMKGKFYINDKASQTVYVVDRNGLTGKTYPGGRNCGITRDEAGNIIISNAFFPDAWNSETTIKVINPETDEMKEYIVPEECAIQGRCDFIGFARGNLMEDGVLYISGSLTYGVSVFTISGGDVNIDECYTAPCDDVAPTSSTVVNYYTDLSGKDALLYVTRNAIPTKLSFIDDNLVATTFSLPYKGNCNGTFPFVWDNKEFFLYPTLPNYQNGFAIATAGASEPIVSVPTTVNSNHNGFQANWLNAEEDGEGVIIYQYYPGNNLSVYRLTKTGGSVTEQTAAPVINGTIDHVTGTYTIALSPGEDNSVIYYRYINYSDDEWSEWMEYVNPIQFTEQGMYRIEAYAVAPGKQSSVHVYYDFMNSGPVYTATPTITAEETDNAVIVTATGDGDVKLYMDGVEVENPYVIPKQEQTMTYNFTATAQKEGYHISNEASLTVTVPGYGSGITVYVKADRAPHLFSWVPDGNGSWINPLGDWPGSVMSNIMTVNRVQYYTYTFDPFPSVNIILNNGSGGFGNQTGDFVNITEDAYFVYNGGGLAYGVIPPTVYGNPTGEYAFYVNTDHWSKVNAVLDGVSYPMTLVGTDGAGYEVYKWENNIITAPSTITFNDGAGHQVVDASGHVYSSDYVKGGYYIYTFFASKQYASLDMPTVITYEGEDQRPVLEDCAITLKSSNEVWNSYNDVSFDITGTYFNPAARQGRALYSVDGGEWVEFTSLLNSEQRFTQNVTLSFNPDVTRHTIRLAAQDLSGAYSAIVTVLEVTDAKALLCYDLPELEYTGEPLTFEPWIYDPYSYQQLTLGEDYTVSFSNNVNVGPASMNVQAIYPAYIGETTFTYAIIPHPISGEAYVVGGPFYYNGNAFTPAVVVIDDLLGELTPGEDYTVSYIDNVEIGEAIAIVEGIGRCTGLIDVPFEILDPPMNERDWNIIKLFYSQYQNDQFVWNVDDPVSAKYNPGLTVENERVTGIELQEQGLEGGFPTMLLSLDELRTLDLSYNNLNGDAASDMAQYAAAEGITATGLQNLYINNNEFTGNVGQMAALFGNLTNLNVSANHFDKVYPMVNPGVNLSLSEQLLEMDADITPGIESVITSIPTICLYDHAAQTFLTSLSAQLTDQAQSPVWTMDLSFNNGAFNMYTSSPYRGLNGQILDGYTWLNSSWYNEQLLKVKFIFAPGDANINGPVDITDLQAMVNYIFGEYYRPFNYTAANLNNDNTVNVQDVVGEANLLLSMDLTMGASGPGRAPVLETTTPQASLYWQDGVLYLNTSVPVAALDIVNDVNGDIKWNVANRGMVVKTARGTQGEHTVIYSLDDAVIPPGLTAIATTTSHGATVVAAKLSDTDAELVKIKLNDGLTRLTDVPTDGNVQCQIDGNSLIINSGNPLENVNIGIYTIDGKVIADKHLSHLDSGQTRISMSDFAYSNGYLIIVVRNGRQVIATQKLTQIK